MVFACHRDALYLSEPVSCSRAGGDFFLSNDVTMPENNGAVLNIGQIIKSVITSEAEAEIGAVFINAREYMPQRMKLIEMGHLQP